MVLAQSIIGTSFFSVGGPPSVSPSLGVPTNILTSHPDQVNGFFRRDYNTGYFSDNPDWFATQTPSYSGEDDYINIGSSLNDPDIDNYSIQWTGYFVPPSNGSYMFRTTSDDASYVWLGLEALSGFTTGNAIVNNGDAHGDRTISSASQYTMYTNTAYPMRVQYGEAGGSATMYAEFSADGGSTWSHFINHCFRISSTTEGFLPFQSAYRVFALDGSSYGGSGPWVDSISSKSFTLYNSPTWSSTNGGQFRFDASQSQWGESGGPGTSLPSLGSFTIQGVFKLHSLPSSGQLPCLITENWPGTGTKINYAIGFLNSSSQLESGFFDSNGGGYWNVLNNDPSPSTGTWYDVVCTFDGSTKLLSVYLNGSLITNVSAPGTAASDNQGIRIARRWDDAQYLDSTVKAINIWKGVLTDNEVISQHAAYNSLV